MFGNSDQKMVLISSTTNHWPQNHIDDQKGSPMASSTARVMDKSIHEEQQHQPHQQELRCPRCDSSNTKFCYYNNYSFSQPRHFCKACKRYWTKGGTLRNVPVGGGCRKNKRVKKPSSSSPNSIPNPNPNPNPNPDSSSSLPHEIDLSSNSSAHMSSLFYGLPNNPSDHMNVPFTGFNPVYRADRNTDTGFDLQHLLNINSNNSLGLGFSSGPLSSGVSDHNGFSNSLLSSYSLFGNPTSTTSTSTIASLVASKFINGDNLKDTRAPRNHFQTSFDQDLHVMESQEQVGKGMKHLVKVGEDRLGWNNSNFNLLPNGQNQAEDHQIGLSDPDSPYWNSTAMGTNWHDPSNLGSSVTSLI